MKKAILAGFALAALMAGWTAAEEAGLFEERVNEARVNAQIDARLHQICAQLIASQRATASR